MGLHLRRPRVSRPRSTITRAHSTKPMPSPKPSHTKKLSGLASQAQQRAMIHVQHSQVGNNNEHIAKLLAHSPELGHAAKQLAKGKPWHAPNTEMQKDSAVRARKAMKKAVAFHKASKGLKPVGKSGKRLKAKI